MRWRAAQVCLVALAVFATAAAAMESPHSRAQHPPKARPSRDIPPPLECGDYVGFQVLLDRQGFSPGQIDGRPGANLAHALAAYQASHGLIESGTPDCATWQALGGDSVGALLATYIVDDEDLNGSFVRSIPARLVQQAWLPALGYRSPLERLAEKFHVSPGLLTRLNPDMRLAKGGSVLVPAVAPFDPSSRPLSAADGGITILVSREDSSVRAIADDGRIVFFAPVTTGSAHDPLPIGDWTVTGVRWMPQFHYNPRLFWDAKADDTRATIKPGPNNPVGVVWIDLDRPHYGLHGTPEPGSIGRTASHGCVRLTNWDAARVSALVKPGTPVYFR